MSNFWKFHQMWFKISELEFEKLFILAACSFVFLLHNEIKETHDWLLDIFWAPLGAKHCVGCWDYRDEEDSVWSQELHALIRALNMTIYNEPFLLSE